MFVFRGLEELEHCVLSVDRLYPRSSFCNRLLGLPLILTAYTLALMVLPLCCVLFQPGLLLKPSLLMDLLQYYSLFTPAWLASVTACIFHWLFPMQMWEDLYDAIYQSILRISKERGIKYEVEKSETYYLRASEIPKGKGGAAANS